jgi:coenzyme F420 hydrogenase subunit beta
VHLPETHWEVLKREVIDTGLCTRCGSCVGVCPAAALAVSDEMGECLPGLIGDCKPCAGECAMSCPGQYVDFPALNLALHGRQPESCLLGNYRRLYIAHAADETIRSAGASGGIITSAVKHLFDAGRIEGAYVMGMDSRRPYFPRSFLARNAGEAQSAAQSKYTVSLHNAGLASVEGAGGHLAYVGLPCQVHSLRKLQQAGHAAARRFRYVLGIYCGNIMHFSSTEAFLRKEGVRDLSTVVRLEFRAGKWPGNMRVELQGGRVIEMPKFHANYLIPFHIMKRCLLCADLTNEFADISGGDAWAPVYEERGEGFSVMIVRTPRGRQITDEMIRQGKLAARTIGYDEIVAMHSHGLDLKKRGVFIRISRRAGRGRRVPQYGFALESSVSLSRRLMDWVMDIVFRMCWSATGKRLIRLVPNRLLGPTFQGTRRWWKGVTRTTKRGGLGTLRFAIDPPGDRASADWRALGRDPSGVFYEEADSGGTAADQTASRVEP